MTTHDELKKVLEGLSDSELLSRCVHDILESRKYRADRGLQHFRDLDWQECVRRGRKDVWDYALAEVRRREAAHLAANRAAAERLGRKDP